MRAGAHQREQRQRKYYFHTTTPFYCRGGSNPKGAHVRARSCARLRGSRDRYWKSIVSTLTVWPSNVPVTVTIIAVDLRVPAPRVLLVFFMASAAFAFPVLSSFSTLPSLSSTPYAVVDLVASHVLLA